MRESELLNFHNVFQVQYTLHSCGEFFLTHFWQKFRENNGFTKEITKELIWRNIFSVRVKSSFFHIVLCKRNTENHENAVHLSVK